MFHPPVPNPLKFPTNMRSLRISQHPLLFLVPFPVYCADVRIAHQGLSNRIYAVLCCILSIAFYR